MSRGFTTVFAVLVAALVFASSALADPRISATATLDTNRMVTWNWNVPASSWGGSVIINPTPQTDSTGALPFSGGTTIDFHTVGAGTTTYFSGVPLDMTITQPTTIYAQVQLIDPFGDGSCTQGDFQAECDSAVMPLTIQPICTTTVVTAAYYSKKLVTRAHYLRRNGHYVKWTTRYHKPEYSKKHGLVWVNAVFKQIYHPAVTQQNCH